MKLPTLKQIDIALGRVNWRAVGHWFAFFAALILLSFLPLWLHRIIGVGLILGPIIWGMSKLD